MQRIRRTNEKFVTPIASSSSGIDAIAASGAIRSTLRVKRHWLSGALFVVLSLLGAPARANGRFPNADLLVIGAEDSAHILVRTTFGLLESVDGGATFAWTCERPLSLGEQEDPMLAVTASGTRVAATMDGVVFSDDGCSWSQAPDLSGDFVRDLSLVRQSPHELFATYIGGLTTGSVQFYVARSDDDGHTWSTVGDALPEDVYPLSIDVAPSDSARVYLTGLLGSADDSASALLVSSDGGESFERLLIDGSSGRKLAYIAGVHPDDADQLYLRIDDPDGTVVLRSPDAGQTQETLMTGAGALLGFAISPDGDELVLGGPDDGVWGGPTDGTPPERRSDVGARCLAFGDAALYACASEADDGFSIGRSEDVGASFDSVLAFSELCGETQCARTDPVAMECEGAWPDVAVQLGTECGTDVGSSGTEQSSKSGGCALARTDEKESGSLGFWLYGCAIAVLAGRRRRAEQHRR